MSFIESVHFQKKEKRKFPYHFRKNAEVDTADLQLYEPVERMPPFTRKTLVLVGPPGVGRKALIQRIVQQDTKLFETTKAGMFQCYSVSFTHIPPNLKWQLGLLLETTIHVTIFIISPFSVEPVNETGPSMRSLI